MEDLRLMQAKMRQRELIAEARIARPPQTAPRLKASRLPALRDRFGHRADPSPRFCSCGARTPGPARLKISSRHSGTERRCAGHISDGCCPWLRRGRDDRKEVRDGRPAADAGEDAPARVDRRGADCALDGGSADGASPDCASPAGVERSLRARGPTRLTPRVPRGREPARPAEVISPTRRRLRLPGGVGVFRPSPRSKPSPAAAPWGPGRARRRIAPPASGWQARACPGCC